MILVGMGANLPTVHGGLAKTLASALEMMPTFGITVSRRSSVYRTEAVAPYAQPPFANAVVAVETALPARALLEALHRLEAQLGRVRRIRWGERTLDLDLLDYEGEVIPLKGRHGLAAGPGPLPMCLPHPAIGERAFVLVPLLEIAPEWRHPVSGDGAEALLRRLVAEEGPGVLAGIERSSR